MLNKKKRATACCPSLCAVNFAISPTKDEENIGIRDTKGLQMLVLPRVSFPNNTERYDQGTLGLVCTPATNVQDIEQNVLALLKERPCRRVAVSPG